MFITCAPPSCMTEDHCGDTKHTRRRSLVPVLHQCMLLSRSSPGLCGCESACDADAEQVAQIFTAFRSVGCGNRLAEADSALLLPLPCLLPAPELKDCRCGVSRLAAGAAAVHVVIRMPADAPSVWIATAAGRAVELPLTEAGSRGVTRLASCHERSDGSWL